MPQHVEQEYWHTRQDAAVFDLSSRGKVELTGPDTASFLHNLCTNDILHLSAGRGCEAFFATLKAKVIAQVHIFRGAAAETATNFWIDVEASATEKLLKHLNHFLISEQVEISERTKEFAQLHIAGPAAASALHQTAGEPLAGMADLEQRQATLSGIPCTLRRHDRLALPGYDVLCPKQEADTVRQMLTQGGAHPAGTDAWDMLRIEAGMPVDGLDFDENCLVMELGRTRQAISYNKGCYLGQEPVVRIRDLGHVNRALLGVKIRARSALKSGTKLWREGTEVGHVTSSTWSPRLQTAIGLAFIRRGNQETGTVLHLDQDGEKTTAEVVPLPFA